MGEIEIHFILLDQLRSTVKSQDHTRPPRSITTMLAIVLHKASKEAVAIFNSPILENLTNQRK